MQISHDWVDFSHLEIKSGEAAALSCVTQRMCVTSAGRPQLICPLSLSCRVYVPPKRKHVDDKTVRMLQGFTTLGSGWESVLHLQTH